MILFVTVFLIEKEWLSLLTLLKTRLSRQFCSENLLQIGKNTRYKYTKYKIQDKNTKIQWQDFVGESPKKSEKYSPLIYWTF